MTDQIKASSCDVSNITLVHAEFGKIDDLILNSEDNFKLNLFAREDHQTYIDVTVTRRLVGKNSKNVLISVTSCVRISVGEGFECKGDMSELVYRILDYSMPEMSRLIANITGTYGMVPVVTEPNFERSDEVIKAFCDKLSKLLNDAQ